MGYVLFDEFVKCSTLGFDDSWKVFEGMPSVDSKEIPKNSWNLIDGKWVKRSDHAGGNTTKNKRKKSVHITLSE